MEPKRKKSLIIVGLVVLAAVTVNFYGSAIVNGSFYYYHYLLSDEEVELGDCKIHIFDGWVIYKRENNLIRFIKMDSDKLNYFVASIKHEDVIGLKTVLVNGHSIIGRYRENQKRGYDLMYYFPEYKIKISYANQKSRSNDLAEKFAEGLICLSD